MRVLITGIAGLLGSSLARWILHNTDHDVLGVDDLSCGMRTNIPETATWRKLHLGGSGEELDVVFRSYQPHLVYHCAAYAAECLSPFVRRYNYQNNLLATAEVVNACINHGVRRLVFTSSMAVYGRGTVPLEEIAECRPIDPYGVAKYAAEQDLRIAGEQHGLEWVIIRPHNVYGPGQSLTQQYRNVFGIWMHRHMRGQSLRIYGDGQQRRAFSYIGDIVQPLWVAGQSMEAAGLVINLGGSTPITILEAAQTLREVLGGGRLEFCEPRREVKNAWCTTARSERILGYRDYTGLLEGLATMYRWAMDARHVSGTLPRIEVAAGLPSYWRSPTSSAVSRSPSGPSDSSMCLPADNRS
jgi:UDP-glucose 4-epimerase